MFKSFVVSVLGATAIIIAVLAVYLASGGTLRRSVGDGGAGAVVEEAAALQAIRSTVPTVEDPDPSDLYCRGAKYSTKGVALEVVKLVGDDRCFPTMQLGESVVDDGCPYGYWTGDLYGIDGSTLPDQEDKCGTVTVQDIRMRAVIYVDAAQVVAFEERVGLGEGESIDEASEL